MCACSHARGVRLHCARTPTLSRMKHSRGLQFVRAWAPTANAASALSIAKVGFTIAEIHAVTRTVFMRVPSHEGPLLDGFLLKMP